MKKWFLFALPIILHGCQVPDIKAQEPPGILERLSKLESMQADINGIQATQTRIRADVFQLREELKLTNDKIDALTKAVLPNANFTASTKNEWGDGRSAVFTNTLTSTNASSWGDQAGMQGYTSGQMARIQPIRRLFSRGRGSCSSSG